MKAHKIPQMSDSAHVAIRKLFHNIDVNVDVLQVYLVDLVREAADPEKHDKKSIMHKEGEMYQTLEFLFAKTPRGMDRGTLAAWFKAYTPIRPKFKANGHFEAIGFARKAPTWDVAGATVNPWWLADPEATRKVSKPDMDKAMDLVLIQAAKLASIEDCSIESIVDALKARIEKADEEILANMDNERVLTFTQTYVEQTSIQTTH